MSPAGHKNLSKFRIFDSLVDLLPELLKNNDQILGGLEERHDQYIDNLSEHLDVKNPFIESATKLAEFERRASDNPLELSTLEKALPCYLEFEQFAGMPASDRYWSNEVSKIKDTGSAKQVLRAGGGGAPEGEDQQKVEGEGGGEGKSDDEDGQQSSMNDGIRLLYRQLMQEWRKHLDAKSKEWELEQIQLMKSEFMKSIEEWIEHLKAIAELVNNLGMDPGFFLDFSEGGTSLTDIEALKKWMDTIRNDPGIREICEILGRIRQIGHSTEIQKAQAPEISSRWIPDLDSKEEIVGIELGNSIERAIPSELSLLADPETAILFDLKLVESKLLCFKLSGMQSVDETVMVEQEVAVEVENPKGPIILCVDTSGSMHGSPENVAKAVTLHMVNIAKKDERDCYLINFSTDIERLDFSAGMKFPDLLNFLRKSFHGGTDPTPALKHSLELMKGETYSNADLIMLSDFVMADLGEDLLSGIEELRENGNKFHALCISQNFLTERLRTHFDQEWVYNPSKSSVTKLIEFSDAI